MSVFSPLKHAIRGILGAINTERNIRAHILIAVYVLVLAHSLGISICKYSVIVLCLSVVIAMELINTAIEKALDLFFPHFDHTVRAVKDIAAGAVLVLSLGAGLVTLVVLGNAFLNIDLYEYFMRKLCLILSLAASLPVAGAFVFMGAVEMKNSIRTFCTKLTLSKRRK